MATETTITEDAEGGSGAPGAEAHGFHLVVMSPEAFFSQPLPASGVVTVGRSSKCAVRIEDPLASREHAQIHIEPDAPVGAGAGAGGDSAATLAVVDMASANGTRVRDAAVKPGEKVAIVPGEAVLIGSTVVMVMQDRTPAGPRRLWSHAYFESRVDEECLRAAKARSPFALARVQFKGPTPWTKVLPILARDLPAPHGFAAYGPKDYEALLVEVKEGEAERLVAGLVAAWRAQGLEGWSAVAWYPRDGRSGDALLARANALLKAAAPASEASTLSASGAADAPEVAEMQRVREMAARAAPSSINVLILGETGVGKDVLARLLHRLSARASKPFLALNCAGLPETLIESELFGHEKGAFTGATGAKLGLLESANGGTVFLDEIGEMALPMQARLLRVIEAREVLPVGAVRARPIDVRFVAATNLDLEAAVLKGTFRRDLMYRLNGITLAIPPLRERTEEIPALVTTFIADACAEAGRRDRPGVSPEAMDYLLTYGWPGNIRELKNVVERALVLGDGPVIQPEHLPLEKMRPIPDDYVTGPVRAAAGAMNATPPYGLTGDALPPVTDPKKRAERQRIVEALTACNSNQTRAAQLLGMPRRTFVSKLDYYGIPRPQKGASRTP